MDGYVYFQLDKHEREQYIELQRFYLIEARRRLLGQFNNLEQDAKDAEASWLERASQRFDPERDDEGSNFEAAQSEGNVYYQMLEEMRDNVRLGIVASMYHQLDKQFREWMVREVRHWWSGPEVRRQIWTVTLGDLIDFFRGLGWDIAAASYFPMLDACRLVVNVYKHGDGAAFTSLRKQYAQYLKNSFVEYPGYVRNTESMNYSNLRVTEGEIEEFSDAIVSFWMDVPSKITNDGTPKPLPKWFEKAILKD